ncbi:Anthranilate synthase, amidotransferase component [Chitinispirillum alkaliphilum]|nr:Anthranilate synthase, amidotransferase component [Chitinispirillum alkaliphilum]
MLLIIDNYDSFTFNLVQYFGELYKGDIQVYRNDKIKIAQIENLNPSAIVISPGPCTPREAGISVEVIKKMSRSVPILGVCLGHQSIGEAFGAKVIRAPYLMHGKTSLVKHNQEGIYKNIPDPFTATRYHSLILERENFPECLNITSETDDGCIMGIQHKELQVYGVQYHPEAILTEYGKVLLNNFLQLAGMTSAQKE